MKKAVCIAHDLLNRLARDSKVTSCGHQLIFFALSREEAPQSPVTLPVTECAKHFGTSAQVVEKALSYLLQAGYFEAIGHKTGDGALYRLTNRNRGQNDDRGQ